MSKKTVLITGANRGIGLSFVKAFVKRGWNVLAAVRDVQKSAHLQNEGVSKIVQLDCCSEESIQKLRSQVGENQPIHFLVNNAGVFERGDLSNHSMNHMLHHFNTNTFSPVLVIKELLPLLKLGSSDQSSGAMSRVVNITSLLGSNQLAKSMLTNLQGGYSYMASKAALNMYTQCIANELKNDNILLVAMHPGYVSTDMNQHQGHVQPDDSVESMLKVVNGLTMQDSGSFKSYTGETIQW